MVSLYETSNTLHQLRRVNQSLLRDYTAALNFLPRRYVKPRRGSTYFKDVYEQHILTSIVTIRGPTDGSDD